MKILFISSLTDAIGNTTTARRIAGHLEAAGHDVHFVPEEGLETPEGLRAAVAAHGAQAALGVHAYFRGSILRHSPVPYVIVFGGTDLNECVANPEQRAVIEEAVGKAAALVALNEDFALRAKNLWPKLAGRVHCIPQAVEAEPSAYSLRAALGLSKEDILFLLPAGLREVKDPLFLAEEILAWHAEDPRVHCAIVGTERDPAYAKKVRATAVESEGLHCRGPLPQPDLFAAMREADAVLNTSKSECSPNSLLEAMYLGAPVIARNIPGNAAVVRHGDTGLLFETPEAFRTQAEVLLQKPALRAALTRTARRYVEAHHSPAAERKAYRLLFSSLPTT